MKKVIDYIKSLGVTAWGGIILFGVFLFIGMPFLAGFTLAWFLRKNWDSLLIVIDDL